MHLTGTDSFHFPDCNTNLIFSESPVIISQIETQYVRDFSQNITIHCQGQGTPAPTMLWYFNSQLVQSTQKYVKQKKQNPPPSPPQKKNSK